MNAHAGPFAPVIAAFNANWQVHCPELAVKIDGCELELDEDHPIFGEIKSLCSGGNGSLPFFAGPDVIWCTIAPSAAALRQALSTVRAWILPSFGGEKRGDGFIHPLKAQGDLVEKILAVAPDGYFRWRCTAATFQRVVEKLTLSRALADRTPPRSRPHRPSLYELRARFSSALLIGDREGSERIIDCLDELQLDSAVNTQFMRIRLWHHFHEYERIRKHPDLDRLRTQPLPGRIEQWITEALTGAEPKQSGEEDLLTAAPDESTALLTGWHAWFYLILRGERNAAESALAERTKRSAADLSSADIAQFVESIEELYLADTLLKRQRDFLSQGIAEFLQDFVREPEFPRARLGNLYLALLRLWGTLHGGTSAGQEHGHVLLELASASLQLNRAPDEVLQIVERWWEARPSRSQLPFLLDAIELLEREFPRPEAPANLWLAAADLILRLPDALAPSEKALWRRVGQRLGIDQASIAHYLPEDPIEEEVDPLAERKLKHIAIVCMRERQAREAAEQISRRIRADVTIVTESVAGVVTHHACTADVILFVWMASTHALFRAFDGFDRRRFCYVQGTGAASIVRTLERWVLA